MANQHQTPRWTSLPRKCQLFVLCLIRVTEPITRFCVNSYIFYQLQYLDPSLPKDEIIKQASYLRTTYTLAQCVSCYFWGRVADSPHGGRKLVMLVALSCSCSSAPPQVPAESTMLIISEQHLQSSAPCFSASYPASNRLSLFMLFKVSLTAPRPS